ncbi:DUF4435 domain-containing protein [Limimaricola sp. G21655-S1]|uniref:DUF4435 domain-containing protein n=1 Tax=Limimaricola sp. G21655-S1 TaxID=3014768 RepID=UPI0022B01C1B|nr:DUF4435 domain-containing protein [Limimaricola sp. G21655-S1]MCZ4260138.1 DUF4435 domain-containing protein [Limimaricola sp. G21655-S1]
MPANRSRPTVNETFELIKRSSLPTVLVEGNDDIIFYRRVEEELSHLQVDILPAGNKDAVIELMEKLDELTTAPPLVYVVDKDLWVHGTPEWVARWDRLITTNGYSVENDLFRDGDLVSLLTKDELEAFTADVEIFVRWYALAVHRILSGKVSAFRTHPGKVLDNKDFYEEETSLNEGEEYPEELRKAIMTEYDLSLRGKSLLSLLHRQLSKDGRRIKYSTKQLIEFGASRKGKKFERLRDLIELKIGT